MRKFKFFSWIALVCLSVQTVCPRSLLASTDGYVTPQELHNAQANGLMPTSSSNGSGAIDFTKTVLTSDNNLVKITMSSEQMNSYVASGQLNSYSYISQPEVPVSTLSQMNSGPSVTYTAVTTPAAQTAVAQTAAVPIAAAPGYYFTSIAKADTSPVNVQTASQVVQMSTTQVTQPSAQQVLNKNNLVGSLTALVAPLLSLTDVLTGSSDAAPASQGATTSGQDPIISAGTQLLEAATSIVSAGRAVVNSLVKGGQDSINDSNTPTQEITRINGNLGDALTSNPTVNAGIASLIQTDYLPSPGLDVALDEIGPGAASILTEDTYGKIVNTKVNPAKYASQPLAVVIVPAYDYNGAFNQGNVGAKVQEYLNHGYKVDYYQVSSAGEMEDAINKATENGAHPAALISIFGHGSQGSIAFGLPKAELFGYDTRLSYADDNANLQGIQNDLAPGGQVVLYSCSTGKGEDTADNVANLFKSVFPQASNVYGPVDDVWQINLSWTGDNISGVTYYGPGENAFNNYVFTGNLSEVASMQQASATQVPTYNAQTRWLYTVEQ